MESYVTGLKLAEPAIVGLGLGSQGHGGRTGKTPRCPLP